MKSTRLLIIPVIVAVLILIFGVYELAQASEPFIVISTAYCNDEGNLTASGRPTVEGLTIAGKKEWIGCAAALYEIDEDGSIGDFIGYREVEDTGYGKPSIEFPGMGTIETGETVDIFISDREACYRWGEHKIYIQIIPGKG